MKEGVKKNLQIVQLYKCTNAQNNFYQKATIYPGTKQKCTSKMNLMSYF